MRHIFRTGITPVIWMTLWVLIATTPVLAEPGVTEWELPTPGGYLISTVEELADYGTCLRDPDPIESLGDGRTTAIYASHIEQWRYHEGHIVGLARKGYFLFLEGTKQIAFFDSEDALLNDIEARRVGPATSQWYTLGNGWGFTWGWPTIMKRVLGSWIDRFILELTPADREALARREGIDQDRLPDHIATVIIDRYKPAFEYDPAVTPLIMAGQYHDAIALKSINDSLTRIPVHPSVTGSEGAPLPDPPDLFIQFFKSKWESITVSPDKSTNPDQALGRSITFYLWAQVLGEYLDPSPM